MQVVGVIAFYVNLMVVAAVITSIESHYCDLDQPRTPTPAMSSFDACFVASASTF